MALLANENQGLMILANQRAGTKFENSLSRVLKVMVTRWQRRHLFVENSFDKYGNELYVKYMKIHEAENNRT